MIAECFNPECREKLQYLRSGRVVRKVHVEPGSSRIEHFWLCGGCYANFDFRFTKRGDLSMVPRADFRQLDPPRDLEWIDAEIDE